MRIVFYVSGFGETAGGVESFILNAFKEFKDDQNHSIELLTRFAYDDGVVYKTFINNGFCITSLGIQHLSFTNYPLFKRKLKKFFQDNKIDVLHIHGTDEPFVVDEAKKSGVKKIIIHSHTPSLENNGRRSITNKLKKVSRKHNERNADVLVACSKGVMKATFSNNTKVPRKVIPNGIAVEQYKYNSKLREKYRHDLKLDRKCVIGHVGRFFEVKNHKFLLEVFDLFHSICQNSALVLIGTGPLESNIHDLVKEKGIEDSVLFLGERDDVSSLLNVIDCVCFPSFFEGLSITLVEAQCSGIPCVVSDGVSEETDLTSLVKRLRLSDSSLQWAEEIADTMRSFKDVDRGQYAEAIKGAGFDRSNIIKELLAIYL